MVSPNNYRTIPDHIVSATQAMANRKTQESGNPVKAHAYWDRNSKCYFISYDRVEPNPERYEKVYSYLGSKPVVDEDTQYDILT